MKLRGYNLILVFVGLVFVLSLASTAMAGYDRQTQQVQQKLLDLGYRPGPADGYWGKRTGNALKKFQKSKGITASGRVDSDTLNKLGLASSGENRSFGGQSNRGIPSGSKVSVPAYNAERRVALVVGNSTYKNSPLKNPENDASDLADVLRSIGFDVIHHNNLNRSGFRDAIREFGDKIRGGGVGVFFYAGHGMQVKGKNYLIPVGVDIQREEEVIDESVEADLIMRTMDSAGNRLNVVILDACRNNPFKRSFRSSGSGLARMDAPRGSLVAFSTSPDSVAADGRGRNSPFTKHLLQAIQTPGLPVEQMFKKVRLGVLKETAKQQTPWELSSLTGEFRFVPDASWLYDKTQGEVKRSEAELARLKILKEKMQARGEKAQVRELERQRLLQEAALKQARMREDATREQAALEKKTQAAIKRDKEKKASLKREREVRLAKLQGRAVALRKEMGSPSKALGLADAAKEIQRINKALARLESDFNKTLEDQLRPVREHYASQISGAEKIPPRDEMFETKQEYQSRVSLGQEKKRSLQKERDEKLGEIRSQVAAELSSQKKPLTAQIEQLTKQTFTLGPSEMTFKLVNYDPAAKAFDLSINVQKDTFIGQLPVSKNQARIFWKNPDLLIPTFTVGLDQEGDVRAVQALFQEPEGKQFTARNLVSAMLESITGMTFVKVSGGCFQMGSNSGESDEKPVHEVCLDDFWMGKYEVTQGQWEKIMGNNPSNFKKGDKHPVEQVSWNDAQKYLKKLSGRSSGRFRLPTEAEWEFACRSGGKSEKYSGGNDVGRVAWYNGNSGGETHQVGTKVANGLGLYDMSGNVWEWVQDIYAKKAYGKHGRNDPIYEGSGSYRVFRGGSWLSYAWGPRCANRAINDPGFSPDSLGFRVVAVSPGR